MTPQPIIINGIGICTPECPGYVDCDPAAPGLVCEPWVHALIKHVRGTEAALAVYEDAVSEYVKDFSVQHSGGLQLVENEAEAARVLAESPLTPNQK